MVKQATMRVLRSNGHPVTVNRKMLICIRKKEKRFTKL
jgi:hypothetical protein